eukprot:g33702.t1
MEFRRKREYLIETYRILRCLDTVDMEKMFPLGEGARTKGHSFRVKGRLFRTEMRRNFFISTVVNLWNASLQRTVEAKSLSVFKTALGRFLNSKGIKGYREK